MDGELKRLESIEGYVVGLQVRYHLSIIVFSFPASRFPGARDSRPFSFPDSRELKRRHSRGKRERVKDNCSLNETPDSFYSAFKRQLLVSDQHHAVPRSYTHRSVVACRTVGCHPCLSGHESRLTT